MAGSARSVPIGARATDPSPDTDAKNRNFRQRSLRMSSEARTVSTCPTSSAAASASTRAEAPPSTSPTVISGGTPRCSTTPGSRTMLMSAAGAPQDALAGMMPSQDLRGLHAVLHAEDDAVRVHDIGLESGRGVQLPGLRGHQDDNRRLRSPGGRP